MLLFLFELKKGSDFVARVQKEIIEDVSKMTVTQCRSAYKKLTNEYTKLKEGAYCHECGNFKSKDKFYKSIKTASGLIPVCKECLYRIGTGYNEKTKETHETRETVIEAMKKADLPFIEDLYETSCNAVTNEASGKKRGTGYSTMITCLQSLPQYFGMSFKDSDITVFGNTVAQTEQIEEMQKENNNIVREKNQEILEQYKMNRRDIIHSIGYDPFENYPVEEDKPILYAQLNSFIDDETKNDGMKMGAVIQIVKKLNQAEKLNDQIDKYISDTAHAADNMPLIDKMASSSQKLMNVATTLAKDNGIKTIVPLQSDLHEKNPLNCWKPLKTIKPQRNDEICISVKVTKVEKINCMRARLNPLFFFNGQSAAKFRIGKGSTTNP